MGLTMVQILQLGHTSLMANTKKGVRVAKRQSDARRNDCSAN